MPVDISGQGETGEREDVVSLFLLLDRAAVLAWKRSGLTVVESANGAAEVTLDRMLLTRLAARSALACSELRPHGDPWSVELEATLRSLAETGETSALLVEALTELEPLAAATLATVTPDRIAEAAAVAAAADACVCALSGDPEHAASALAWTLSAITYERGEPAARAAHSRLLGPLVH